jgi:hypothetical protein
MHTGELRGFSATDICNQESRKTEGFCQEPESHTELPPIYSNFSDIATGLPIFCLFRMIDTDEIIIRYRILDGIHAFASAMVADCVECGSCEPVSRRLRSRALWRYLESLHAHRTSVSLSDRGRSRPRVAAHLHFCRESRCGLLHGQAGNPFHPCRCGGC